MIGNGFDKQLGLATGYDDFLKWYLEQPSVDKSIEEFKNYLSSTKGTLWWSDAELAMGGYLKDFSDNNINRYYHQIRDFKIALVNYLEQQEQRCDYTDKKTTGNLFSDFLWKFSNDVIPSRKARDLNYYGQIFCNFINFNYTNTLIGLISCSINRDQTIHSDKGSIIIRNYLHLHGTLVSGIIMGVNDDDQLSCSNASVTEKLRRTLIKPETNRELSRSEDEQSAELIQESDAIALFGLSLGDTDKKWREHLAKWLDSDDSHRIIYFCYDGLNGIDTRIPEDVLDSAYEKQRELLQKLYPENQESEWAHLHSRVLIVPKTRYLDIPLLSKENIDELAEV